MTSAFPSPNYARLRLHGARAADYEPLHLAREQQLPGPRNDAHLEQDCESEYEECEEADIVPIRQCIQTYYRCIGIDFQ